jgi:hypothetical protein
MRPDAARTLGRGRDRWEPWAVAAWALVLGVVCIKAAGWPRSHSLYPVFAAAAQDWQAGEPLYRTTTPDAGGLDVYRYSPLVAALFTPFSVLPAPVGGVLWRLLNAGVCLTGLAWFCRAVLPRRLPRSQRAVVFLLVLPLAVGNLHNAQSNPLVLGLVLGSVAATAERRWSLAAGCTALACLFKIYPIAVGLLLVVLYPRRFGPRLAAALVVGLALPFLLQDPPYVAAQYASWVDYLRGDDRSGLPLTLCYRDLPLLCRRWISPLDPGAYQVIQVLAGAGIALLCLAQRRRQYQAEASAGGRPSLTLRVSEGASWPERRLLIGLLGLGCCWMTVFGPATESCTYLLLGPTLAWALLETWLERRPLFARAWLAIAYGLLVVTYMSCWFPSGTRLQSLGLQPLAGMMLLAYLLAGMLRPSQQQAGDGTDVSSRYPARAA